MSLIELDKNNFDSVTMTNGIVLIDFWASWCDACSKFKPTYEKIAESNPTHTFATFDTMANKELTSELGISNIPTLMVMKDGIILFQQPGYFEFDKLQDIIHQAEEVDMDLVRMELEANSNE